VGHPPRYNPEQMSNHKHTSTGGGNAHQRALAAKRAESVESAQSVVPLFDQSSATKSAVPPDGSRQPFIEYQHEWTHPLNRADSIGLLGVLVGTMFVILVPTVWYKVAAFALVCFALAYFICLSHWTCQSKIWIRVLLIALVLSVVAACVVPQLVAQWRIEHMHSELKFEGTAPNLGFPDGDHNGIKWSKEFSEVRLTIKSGSTAPIQNLNLSVSVMEKGEAIVGMTQTDQEFGWWAGGPHLSTELQL